MKKNISICLLLTLATISLASCADTSSQVSNSSTGSSTTSSNSSSSSSSSSNSSSSSTPTTDDEPSEVSLKRSGNIDLTLDLGTLGNMFLGAIDYSSPIELAYQRIDDKVAYENGNFSLSILPADSSLASEDILSNYNSLKVLYSLNMLSSLGLDVSFPNFYLSSYYRYNDIVSSLATEEATPETLSLNFLGNNFIYADTFEDKLAGYSVADTSSVSSLGTVLDIVEEGTSALFANLDLSSIDLTLTSIFSLLNTLLPDLGEVQPIISTIGTVLVALGDYVDISIDERSDDYTYITLNLDLNEEGKVFLNDLLSSIPELSAIGTITAEDISLSFSFYDDEYGYTQISSLGLSANINANVLGFLSLPIALDFNCNLGSTEEELQDTYFDDLTTTLNSYSTLASEYDTYFSKIRGYATHNGLLGSESINAKELDVSNAAHDALEEAINSYSSLSDELKFMISDHYLEQIENGTLENNYQSALATLTSAIDKYNSLGTIDSTNISTILPTTVTQYKNWRQGLVDNGGENLISALDSYLTTYLSEYQTSLNTLESATSAYVANSTDEELYTAVLDAYEDSNSFALDTAYFSDELLSEYQSLQIQGQDILNRAKEAISTHVISTLSNTSLTYTDLVNFIDSSREYPIISDSLISLVASDESCHTNVVSVIQAQADQYFTDASKAFVTATEETYIDIARTIRQNYTDIEEIANTYLGENNEVTETISNIYALYLGIMEAFA